MSTLTIITVAILALFILINVAGIYLRRTGRIRNRPVLRRRISVADVVVALLMVAFLIAGVSAPKVAPDSAIAHLITNVGAFVYFAWCMIIAAAIQIAFGLVTRMFAKR